MVCSILNALNSNDFRLHLCMLFKGIDHLGRLIAHLSCALAMWSPLFFLSNTWVCLRHCWASVAFRDVVVPIMLLLSVSLFKDNCDCHPMVERTHILCRLLYSSTQFTSHRQSSLMERLNKAHTCWHKGAKRKKPIEARILNTISSSALMVSPLEQPSATIGPDILGRREYRHSVSLVLSKHCSSYIWCSLCQLELVFTFTFLVWTKVSGKCPQVWHHHHHHERLHRLTLLNYRVSTPFEESTLCEYGVWRRRQRDTFTSESDRLAALIDRG